MADLWYRAGADSAGLSTQLLLGIGLGLLVAGAVLGWLFRVGWKHAEYHMALRVHAMLKDIDKTRAASDAPDPVMQRDMAEVLLIRNLPKRQELMAELAREDKREREFLIHMALGGKADDPHSEWRTIEKRKD